jgi:CheY-like chemotaxis protein
MRVLEKPVAASSLIYVVDDAPSLTTFYTALLEASGYQVRAFNDRAEALAALMMEGKRPDLLVTDYFGLSMSVDQFMQRCRVVHPALRIVMASGVSLTEVRRWLSRPDRFIQKPFTPEEFCEEVKAALAAP